MYIKSVLFVVLSLFMLAGCGNDDDDSSNGTLDDQQSNEVQEQEPGPRDNSTDKVNENDEVNPSEPKNSVIGDDQFDMPDTEGHDKEKTGTNN